MVCRGKIDRVVADEPTPAIFGLGAVLPVHGQDKRHACLAGSGPQPFAELAEQGERGFARTAGEQAGDRVVQADAAVVAHRVQQRVEPALVGLAQSGPHRRSPAADRFAGELRCRHPDSPSTTGMLRIGPHPVKPRFLASAGSAPAGTYQKLEPGGAPIRCRCRPWSAVLRPTVSRQDRLRRCQRQEQGPRASARPRKP